MTLCYNIITAISAVKMEPNITQTKTGVSFSASTDRMPSFDLENRMKSTNTIIHDATNNSNTINTNFSITKQF